MTERPTSADIQVATLPRKQLGGTDLDDFYKEVDGLRKLDLLSLHLKEIGPMNPEKHGTLCARIFAGQLILNYLNQVDISTSMNGFFSEKISEVVNNTKAITMARIFKQRVEKIRSIAREEKEGNGSQDIDQKDIELLEIVDKFNLWMNRQLKTQNAQKIIERQLRIAKGAIQARDELIVSNMRLVVSTAKNFRNRGLTIEDLVQYGYPGLIMAVSRFDHRKKYQLSTYATYWIVQQITRAIANHGAIIRLPIHRFDEVMKLRMRNPQGPLQEDNPSLTSAFQARKVDSLNRVINDNHGDEIELGEFLAAEDDTEQEAEKGNLRELIWEAINTLPPREQRVLILRYGLTDNKARSLIEIGNEFHVTRERIRQLEAKALRRLRQSPLLRKLQEYS